MHNENAKIIILGVGKGVADVLRELTRSNINGADFAFTSMNNSVVDYYVDVPVKFHVSDLNCCERIVKDNFSDTDMMFVIVSANETDELSLASEIARNTKAHGILTVGLVIFTFRVNEYMEFRRSFHSPFDAVFMLQSYVHMRRKTHYAVIECITDLITKSGYVNLDFADIKAILRDAGGCGIGMGHFGGCNRALNAAREAVHDVYLDDAKRILVNITASSDVTLCEMYDAVRAIGDSAAEAQVVWGHVIDDELDDEFRISLIAAYLNS